MTEGTGGKRKDHIYKSITERNLKA